MAYWSELCEVDVAALAAWTLALPEDAWPVMPVAWKPRRVWAVSSGFPGAAEAQKVIWHVLDHLPSRGVSDMCLSRVDPGVCHPMHADTLPADMVTRVHVPLATNPACWFLWESDPAGCVHFEAGKAYSFDARARHAFGNGGDTPRVHLVFDVRG